VTRFRFVEQEKVRYPVRILCAALGVSPSGYYAWRSRGPSVRERSDAELAAQIHRSHARSRGTYGVPRVHADLIEAGYHVSRKRVARLMRQAGLVAKRQRCFKRTTQANPSHRYAPNQLQQCFVATQPNQVWLADVTYIATQAGWLYLAAVLDLHSRRIVGWAIDEQMPDTLTQRALQMALSQRQPKPHHLLHHSDRGSQYTSNDYLDFCIDQRRQLRPSVGRTAVCWDNAVAESFWESLKRECIQGRVFATHAEARRAIFRWINWYNTTRLHTSLNHIPPLEWEQQHRQAS
jgi:putative transposase